MIISDDKTLQSIQREFQMKFPFLKLEFYKKQHAPGEGNLNSEKLDATKNIGTVRSVHNTGDLKISAAITVSHLEQEFYKRYGLNAQVFRKSGDLWLQTTATDNWTLEKQNEKGVEVEQSQS